MIASRFDRQRITYFLLISFTLLCLTNCSNPDNIYATANPDYLNILDNHICWNEICPQVSTWDEADTILESLEIIESEKTRYYSAQIDVPFKSDRFHNSSISFYLEDDVVSRIAIFVAGDNSKNETYLTLKQVVELYGEPDWVFQEELSGGDRAGLGIQSILGYSETGIAIYITGLQWYSSSEPSPPSDYGILDSNFAVFLINYKGHSVSKTEWLEQFPTGGCEFRLEMTREEVLEKFEEFLFPWPGLGEEVPAYLDIDCRKVFN